MTTFSVATPLNVNQPKLSLSSALEQCVHWSWQKVTSQAVTEIDLLAQLLELDVGTLKQATASNDFTLRVPLTFIRRMQAGVLDDPLLLQMLNRHQELDDAIGYEADPLHEKHYNPCPGLIHKYASRVLLTAATSCPLNCRYCFRRQFPYSDNRLSPSTWQPALNYIESDSNIREVILSGGEPLMLKDEILKLLLDKLQAIGHVKLLRIHTRFPIAIPQRLTSTLIDILKNLHLPVTLVTHCNHPQEIDQSVIDAMKPLASSNINLLNQSVILKDINDNVDTLEELSLALIEAGIKPYYLHCMDPVAGTAHFDVGDAKARQLSAGLIDRLPGYLAPTLVREIPDKAAKTRL